MISNIPQKTTFSMNEKVVFYFQMLLYIVIYLHGS